MFDLIEFSKVYDIANQSICIELSIESLIYNLANAISSTAFGATDSPIDLGTALKNLTTAFSSLRILVLSVSYLLGIGLIFKGIMGFKVFGTQTFSSANRGELSGPLVYVTVGALLCVMGSTLDIGSVTIFGQDDDTLRYKAYQDIIAYQPPIKPDKWIEIVTVLQLYAYLAGLIAFLRGLLILSKMGQPGVQPGSFGKGLTHVIGGTLLMHFIPFMQILAKTFGYTSS